MTTIANWIKTKVILPSFVCGCIACQNQQPPHVFVSGNAGISADQAGETVTMQGLYMKWSGDCMGHPPRSRSDWMLQNASGCIYISGKRPTVNKQTTVAVQGTVMLGQDKTPFIVADKVVPQ